MLFTINKFSNRFYTVVNSDFCGRNRFNPSTPQWDWVTSSGGVRMSLNHVGLYVIGPYTNSSDKRLKFNEKPLANALNVISKLEPVEYDQTQCLVDQYTPETPQSHQCGFIAQSVEKIEELRHAIVGGEVDDDGKEPIRGLNYNAIFTYAVKAIQELHEIVKAQQVQIDELQKQLRTIFCMNSATIIS